MQFFLVYHFHLKGKVENIEIDLKTKKIKEQTVFKCWNLKVERNVFENIMEIIETSKQASPLPVTLEVIAPPINLIKEENEKADQKTARQKAANV